MENSEKKVTLLEALIAVSKALENDTIDYVWSEICTCNCGLVAQAITKTSKDELYDYYLRDISERLQTKKNSKYCPTWAQMISEYCPLTGTPTIEIFKALFEAGMNREEIAHLEYLSDPAILKNARIDTDPTDETYFKDETREKGWWIFKKEVTKKVKMIKEIPYYQNKENLLAYIKSWIDVLKRKDSKGKVIIDGEEYKYKSKTDIENLKKLL